MATNGGADALSELLQRFVVALQVEEGLVDRVDLNLLDLGAQGGHHTPREVAIEGEVGREDNTSVSFEQSARLEVGLPHADPDRLRLVRTCYHAPVVVGQYDHGPPLQIGTEDSLTRDKEVVAVAKSVHCKLRIKN